MKAQVSLAIVVHAAVSSVGTKKIAKHLWYIQVDRGAQPDPSSLRLGFMTRMFINYPNLLIPISRLNYLSGT